MKRQVRSAGWSPPLLLLLLLLLLLAGAVPSVGADPDDASPPDDVAAAVFALQAHVEMENAALARYLAAYGAGETRREELRDQISVLYSRIGTLVVGGESSEEEGSLEALVAELQAVQQAEEAVRGTLGALREKIADSRERVRFLREKVARLQRSVPPETESLSGTWDITLLPSGDRAVFTVRQSGTIVSGEYVQEGGWKGSLQGTLINNKVVLHRIDSKLGASSDLEGIVSADLKSIKGTWQSRVLSDGSSSNGAWSGRKRESKKKSGAATEP